MEESEIVIVVNKNRNSFLKKMRAVAYGTLQFIFNDLFIGLCVTSCCEIKQNKVKCINDKLPLILSFFEHTILISRPINFHSNVNLALQ